MPNIALRNLIYALDGISELQQRVGSLILHRLNSLEMNIT